MFGQSFKWMLLTLAVMLLIAAGCFFAWEREGYRVEEAAAVAVTTRKRTIAHKR